MRWPWSRDRADDASVEPAAPGGGVDAVPGPVAPRVAPRGWAFLPPLQRTVAPAPSISRPVGFPLLLATRADPTTLTSMGHLVADDGPTGVVDGLGIGLTGPTAPPTGRTTSTLPDLTVAQPPQLQRATLAPSRPAASDLTRAPRPRTLPPLPTVAAPAAAHALVVAAPPEPHAERPVATPVETLAEAAAQRSVVPDAAAPAPAPAAPAPRLERLDLPLVPTLRPEPPAGPAAAPSVEPAVEAVLDPGARAAASTVPSVEAGVARPPAPDLVTAQRATTPTETVPTEPTAAPTVTSSATSVDLPAGAVRDDSGTSVPILGSAPAAGLAPTTAGSSLPTPLASEGGRRLGLGAPIRRDAPTPVQRAVTTPPASATPRGLAAPVGPLAPASGSDLPTLSRLASGPDVGPVPGSAEPAEPAVSPIPATPTPEPAEPTTQTAVVEPVADDPVVTLAPVRTPASLGDLPVATAPATADTPPITAQPTPEGAVGAAPAQAPAPASSAATDAGEPVALAAPTGPRTSPAAGVQRMPDPDLPHLAATVVPLDPARVSVTAPVVELAVAAGARATAASGNAASGGSASGTAASVGSPSSTAEPAGPGGATAPAALGLSGRAGVATLAAPLGAVGTSLQRSVAPDLASVARPVRQVVRARLQPPVVAEPTAGGSTTPTTRPAAGDGPHGVLAAQRSTGEPARPAGAAAGAATYAAAATVGVQRLAQPPSSRAPGAQPPVQRAPEAAVASANPLRRFVDWLFDSGTAPDPAALSAVAETAPASSIPASAPSAASSSAALPVATQLAAPLNHPADAIAATQLPVAAPRAATATTAAPTPAAPAAVPAEAAEADLVAPAEPVLDARSTTSDPSATAASAGDAGTLDVDLLARRLADPIMRQLRHEVLRGRERLGQRADL
ncbi:MAG: hypothetical protein BGO96_13860 [Micrococcales bacterium 73-15]|uniref:hypothetical protein n=1 Tax=Salana multivorans TaxID=120377 RepID=UPI000965EFB4|nr:hypothetical protein [Salana multivorans]OJX97973.1 MAG: hypothetical protein BGO96_13860 [Micrococcales bacterium 73-15]